MPRPAPPLPCGGRAYVPRNPKHRRKRCAICTPWSASPMSTPRSISTCNKLGLKEVRRHENEQGRYTLIFLAAPDDEQAGITDKAPLVELTYNWDPEDYKGGRNFGHLAYEVDDIYATCQRLMDKRRHHQPAAARRQHGLHQVAGRHLDRAAAERPGARKGGALGVDGQHRNLVGPPASQVSGRWASSRHLEQRQTPCASCAPCREPSACADRSSANFDLP